MCLQTVHKKTQKLTEGYKTFHRYNNKLLGVRFSSNGEPYKRNRWYDAGQPPLIRARDGQKYIPGFHFYKNLGKARKTPKNSFYEPNRIMVKIKIRELLVTGNQNGAVVGVAQKMIIKEVIQ